MLRCDKCRCSGRVTHIAEGEAHYVCANPRCGNYRKEFGAEVVEGPRDPPDTPGERKQ